MNKAILTLLVILSLTLGQGSGQCIYDTLGVQYLRGCFNECQDFRTLEKAFQQCSIAAGCGGVTYSRKENGGNLSKGEAGDGWGYQLRAADGYLPSTNGETSWKKRVCNTEAPTQAKCDFRHKQGYLLSECAQDCKDYVTLYSATQACKADVRCGGVTFAKKENGGKGSTGFYGYPWGYQLRYGRVAKESLLGEDSWIKPGTIYSCGF